MTIISSIPTFEVLVTDGNCYGEGSLEFKEIEALSDYQLEWSNGRSEALQAHLVRGAYTPQDLLPQHSTQPPLVPT